MKHRPPLTTAAAVAVALALPVSAACSGDDGNDAALRARTSEQGADQTTTTAGDDVATSEPTEATDTGNRTGEGDVPQDQELDIEQRHPNGTILRVSRLGFDGDDILIDAEVINSGLEEITFHDGSEESDRLRLVDDAGEEYNFVEAAHEETPFLDEGAIYVAPGETVSGTFAFRGPLFGRPDRLQLVVNTTADQIPGFDIDADSEGTIWPKFVVPFDLTWA